ncbi:MAG: class I SAM-dependent methyltransferase [Rhodospirillaceae bacterium]|jgi:SAM-dependent methyltransferase|nr:class I SAM-dependent methyltransferase [Rhodospirillaceae bacterium]MBT6117926.1 class I SAM-dependent methyltransferase [Rhodospirillaceae bacterium]
MTEDGTDAAAVRDLFDTRTGIAGRYAVARDPAAGLLATRPAPDPAEMAALHAAYRPFAAAEGTAYRRVREGVFNSPLYRLWLAVDGDPSFHGASFEGRVVDLGCGDGRLLDRLARAGVAAEGIEQVPASVRAARARGLTVHEAPLEDFAPTEPFDSAVAANVLEHCADPAAALAAARRILRQGGALRVSCPNAGGLYARLFGRAWINWHVPYHLWHFTAGDLDRSLRDAGFSDIAIRTETPALWLAQSIVVWLRARPGRPTRALRNLLVMAPLTLLLRLLLFPVLWLVDRAGRGDCLIATARRG